MNKRNCILDASSTCQGTHSGLLAVLGVSLKLQLSMGEKSPRWSEIKLERWVTMTARSVLRCEESIHLIDEIIDRIANSLAIPI